MLVASYRFLIHNKIAQCLLAEKYNIKSHESSNHSNAFVMLVITTSVVMISRHEYVQAQEKKASQIASELQTSACIQYSCIEVEYESPTTVVLNGHYILSNSSLPLGESKPPNTILWQGVDALKSQGFAIESVTMGGEGREGNPNVYHIVMSKPFKIE